MVQETVEKASKGKRRRFAFGLALFGFAANAALFAYVEVTDYSPLSPLLRVLADVFCPATVLGAYLLFDFKEHTAPMAAAWGFLGLVNTAIYFGVGVAIGKLVWKSDRLAK